MSPANVWAKYISSVMSIFDDDTPLFPNLSSYVKFDKSDKYYNLLHLSIVPIATNM